MPILVSQNSRIFTFQQIFLYLKFKSHFENWVLAPGFLCIPSRRHKLLMKKSYGPSAASASETSQRAQPEGTGALDNHRLKVDASLPPRPVMLLCNNTSNEVIPRSSETNYSTGKCFGKALYLWESLLISHHYYTCDFKGLWVLAQGRKKWLLLQTGFLQMSFMNWWDLLDILFNGPVSHKQCKYPHP